MNPYLALGGLVWRRPRLVLVVAALFLAGALALLHRGGRLSGASIYGLEADRAQAAVDVIAGRREETTVLVLLGGKRLRLDEEAFGKEVDRTLAPLRADPRVASVTTARELPDAIRMRLEDPRTATTLAFVLLKGEVGDGMDAWPELRRKLASDELSITCTGKIPFLRDLGAVLEHDLIRAELVSIPLALLVLVLVFRTAVAAALPVGVGGLAVVVGIGLVFALSHVVEVAQYTINVCSLIGFGVAIDYSLFLVSRYREELARGLDFREALLVAMNTAGRAVTFSGLAVAIGLVGLLFYRGSYLAVMGIGGAIVVALAVVAALTLLPALLVLLGPRIDRLRLPGLAKERAPSRFWHGVATAVMKRPVAVLVPTLGVLLLLASPVLRMRVSASDARILPAGIEARAGYEMLVQRFPALAANRVLVVASFPGPLTRERVGALWDTSHRIAALPHVVRVESIVDPPAELGFTPSKEDLEEAFTTTAPEIVEQVREGTKFALKDDRTVLHVLADVAPDTAEAGALVDAIRAGRAVGDGVLEVGGQAAYNVDSSRYLKARAPYALGFVLAATFVVVLVLLRSLLLPLKAVFMNVLSISASFGALVWVFQDGHLFVHDGHPMDPSLPVLLFCISFGLSMDYEVLMLARMKEIYEETGETDAAVALGLEATAGLITSAAAVMVSVFLAFALARVVVLQATGVGMALAILLDATLVRALLVPATVRLLGRANWWAPTWLRGDR